MCVTFSTVALHRMLRCMSNKSDVVVEMATHPMLFFPRKGTKSHVDKEMKEYYSNNELCRRDFLFNDFDSFAHDPSNIGCKCCDICAAKCECSQCVMPELLTCYTSLSSDSV